jgi:23S rRNA (guanosine2251-2'-O)-methyltransferase
MKNKKQFFQDFVYGVHPILELLQAKRRKIGTLYTTKQPIKAWDLIEKHLPVYVPIQKVSRETLDNIAGTPDHQGIIAFVPPFPFQKVMFNPSKSPFILVLDEIQDVRNLGAILRSAYCTGIDGVILCRRNSAPLTPAAFKASAGLAEHLPIFIAPTIKTAFEAVKSAGYHIYCATLEQGENAIQVEFSAPAALVIGNEEQGIPKSLQSHGTRVLLPQKRADISYNASVAAGILLFMMGTKLHKI